MNDPVSSQPVPISTAVGSILGKRSRNNDRIYADASATIVIDGAGGSAFTGVTATTALAGALLALAQLDPDDPRRAVGAVDGAAASLRGLDDAGQATITVIALSGGSRITAHLAWLGDSPAFLLRDGVLHQLTRPHNRAQELAERRMIDFAHIPESPLANELTRGLDGGSAGPAETLAIALEPGDRLLAATDGVLAVPPSSIGWALSRGDDAHTAAGALIDAAIDRGARDNTSVSVIVIDAPRPVATGSVGAPLPVEDALFDEVVPQWSPTAAPTDRRRGLRGLLGRERQQIHPPTGPLPDL